MTSISELGLGLIIAEGQLEDAIREQRRWRLREDEASQMRQQATDRVMKWQRILDDLKRQLV